MIKERNKGVESLRIIEISWLRWFKLPKPEQLTGHLIFEFTSSSHANTVIDKNFVISSSLKICQVYNKVYKNQQFFNCQNYDHNTSQCIYLVACCQCVRVYNSKKCPGILTHRCIACKGAYTAFHKSCKL